MVIEKEYDMEVDLETLRARIEQLIELLADGSQREFSRKVGIDETILSKLLKSGKRQFNENHLRSIERATRARLEWMKFGQEPMLWPAGQTVPERPPHRHEGQMLRDYLDRNGPSDKELAARIGRSPSTVSKYFASATFDSDTRQSILTALNVPYHEIFDTDSGKRREIFPLRTTEEGVYVVRIPLRARAGLGYTAYFAGPETEREYVAVALDKLYPGVKQQEHAVVVVNGDSMEPVLEHGYEMLCYRLPPEQFPHINKIVVVDFRDELTIKRLAAVDWVDKTITLRSDNGGAEMRLPMAEIRGIWHVYDYHRARL